MEMSHALKVLNGLTPDESVPGLQSLTGEEAVQFLDAAEDKHAALDRLFLVNYDSFFFVQESRNDVIKHYRGFGIAGRFTGGFIANEIAELWEEGGIPQWGEYVPKKRKSAARNPKPAKSKKAKPPRKRASKKRRPQYRGAGYVKCPNCGSREQERGCVCDKCGYAV